MKIKNIFFIFLFCFFLFISCASTNRPYWEQNSQYGLKKDMIGFIGYGESEDLSEAKLLAYEMLSSNISLYLGRELTLLEFRELITTDSIAELNISILNMYNTHEPDKYYYSVHAYSKLSVIGSFRTDEAKSLSVTVSKIENLVNEGDKCFIENKDVEGLSFYLQSLCLSKGLDNYLDKEYKYDSILAVVKDVLNNIKIILVSEDSSKISCILRVLRFDTLLPSRVKNSDIVAFFNARDPAFTIYEDKYVFRTDENGDLYFYPVNANIVTEGSVKFTLNLYDDIKNLSYISPEDSDVLLKYLEENVTFIFNYSKLLNEKVAIFSYENSENENEVTENILADYLVNKFVSNGYNAYLVSTGEHFLTELRTLNLLRSSDIKDTVVIVKSTIKDIISLKNSRILVSLEVEIFLSRNEDETRKIDFIVSGVAESKQEAFNVCCERFSDIAFSKFAVILDNRY